MAPSLMLQQPVRARVFPVTPAPSTALLSRSPPPPLHGGCRWLVSACLRYYRVSNFDLKGMSESLPFPRACPPTFCKTLAHALLVLEKLLGLRALHRILKSSACHTHFSKCDLSRLRNHRSHWQAIQWLQPGLCHQAVSGPCPAHIAIVLEICQPARHHMVSKPSLATHLP